MGDKYVDLITISENENLILHNSVLENVFHNNNCPIAILTVINDSENFDPYVLELIRCYFAKNGNSEYYNDVHHRRWNPTQKAIPGVKIWSKPLRLHESHSNKYLDVIIMENNINAEIDEEIKLKLIAFSIDISSNILYNTNESLMHSSLKSLVKSIIYTNPTKRNEFLLMFLVRDWKNKKPKLGIEGGELYYTTIIKEKEFDNIHKILEKQFRKIKCILMPSSESSHSTTYAIGSRNDAMTELKKHVNKLIDGFLDIDKIFKTNLNALECTEKIQKEFKNSEFYSEAEETKNVNKFMRDHENLDEIHENSHGCIIEKKSLESQDFPISSIKSNHEINKKLEYINLRKSKYFLLINSKLTRKIFLDCNYSNGIHDNLVKDEIRKFHDNWKDLYSNKSDENLLVEALDSQYKNVLACQTVFIEFWNSTYQEFMTLIYFGNEEIQNFLIEKRERIQEIKLKVEKGFYDSLISIFDETCNEFVNNNNIILKKELEIAKKNAEFLKEIYRKKLMQEIENNSFAELILLKNYNDALADVCLKSLNAGLEFRDKELKQNSEKYLQTILEEAFEPIKIHFENQLRDKNLTSFSNKKINTYSDELFAIAVTSEKLLNSHDSNKNEVNSISKGASLVNDRNHILDNHIQSSLTHFSEVNNERVKIEEPIVAIDFGTCFIRYGYIMNNQIEISKAFPNYVAFSGKDILIGEEAEKFAKTQPENVIIHSKLFLGGPDLGSIKSELYSFEICKNKGNFIEFLVNFDGRKTAFKCEEIVSLILIKIKRDVELLIGTRVHECVITVPNSFNVAQREGMKSAAAIAGLNVKSLINDITAATIGYQRKPEAVQKEIIIAHSGSNSFNIALMRLSSQNNLRIENLHNSYALNCTGIAIDNVLMMRSGCKFKSEKYRLRKECEKSKIEIGDKNTKMSSLDTYNIRNINELLELVDMNFHNFMEFIDRGQYLRDIILIGGSFKFKNIFNLYQKISTRNKRISLLPDEIIIEGAAIFAHSLRNNKPRNERNIEIIEKLNSTISTKNLLLHKPRRNIFRMLGFNDSAPKNVIPINTPLPHKIETRRDPARGSRFIELYQGENNFSNQYQYNQHNQYIGKFELVNSSKAKIKIFMNPECIISLEGYKFEKFKLSDEMIKLSIDRLSEFYKNEELDRSNENIYYSAVESTIESNSLRADESDDKKEFMKFLAEFERDFINDQNLCELANGVIRNALKNAKVFAEDADNFNREGIKLHMKIMRSNRDRFFK